MLNSPNIASDVVCRLPNLVDKLVQIKIKESNGKEESEGVDLEEEAEEDLVAENTHLGLMPQKQGESGGEE